MEILSAAEEKGSGDLRPDDLNGEEWLHVRASAEFLANLRHMVNAPAFSDVVFNCNDGEQVHASRMLLAGRSDVLKSMLTNSMAESSLSKIELPEISSKVLLAVFEFLYTGTLLDYPPTSWRTSCELVIASRFFLLPSLEMMLRKFMCTQISAVGEDFPKAACLLTEAMEFKALSAEADVIPRELVTILSSNWSASFHVKSLSEDAFHYLLATTKTNCEEDDYKLSFREYLRFRQVVRWWAHQSEDGSFRAEEIMSLIAPDEVEARRICKNVRNLGRVDSPLEDEPQLSNDWEIGLLDEESRSSVIRLLSNIDFLWIHPILLAKLVEPLKVVPPAEILSAFRFHAPLRPAILKSFEWELCVSHVALDDGYVVQKVRKRIGLAVMKEAMSRSYGVYQWRFIVEHVPAEFCEVGFLYFETPGKQRLSDMRLSNLSHARVLNFQNSRAYVNWGGVGGRTDWKALVSITPSTMFVFFNYDASEHSCSLSINGQERGVIWRDLPSAVYYPAVSLGTSNVGRVRVQLVSGFDII